MLYIFIIPVHLEEIETFENSVTDKENRKLWHGKHEKTARKIEDDLKNMSGKGYESPRLTNRDGKKSK